jgi:hypothetical protein
MEMFTKPRTACREEKLNKAVPAQERNRFPEMIFKFVSDCDVVNASEPWTLG